MSPNLPSSEKCEVMSKFMHTLLISGYDERYRSELLKGIMARIGQVEDDILAGKRIRYRKAGLIMKMKKDRMGNFPDTWFLKEGNLGLLKV